MIEQKVFKVADTFCGAGGSSSGAARAIRRLGGHIDLVAVNHWPVAIATHSRNHPNARHFCVNLDAARPEDIVPEGYLDLLMASPECVFFSRARGGRPVSDQRRMSAWHVQRWASALDIRCILVENVAEFRDWGPLVDGRPDPKKKGLYFEAWVKSLWEMGYVVDWKLVNSADFGAATTRTRFFLQARKDGKPIKWPTATHSPTGADDLFGGQRRWRAAREVIDWASPGRSILGRKKPLSEKTRRRIARGLIRFGGALGPLYVRLLDLDDAAANETAAAPGHPEPFVFANREHGLPKSIDGPIPVITTVRGWNVGIVEPIVEPFIVANRNHAVPKGTDKPIPTATTSTGGGIGLVEPSFTPFTLGQQSGAEARSIEDPMATIATSGAIGLVDPMIAPYYGTADVDSIDDPLATVTTKSRFGLCSPMVVPFGPRTEARDVADPMPTILTKDRLGVCIPTVEPFVLSRFGEFSEDATPRAHAIDKPLPTMTASGGGYLVEPFLVPQFGERSGQEPRIHDVKEPLPAVTGHGAGALVEPTLAVAGDQVDPRRLVLVDGQPYLLDIRFRMLNNRELARAMGFDDESEYEFTGNAEEVTRQIGNAVECNTATALVTAILGD